LLEHLIKLVDLLLGPLALNDFHLQRLRPLLHALLQLVVGLLQSHIPLLDLRQHFVEPLDEESQFVPAVLDRP
jgi:hypothetical protein